MILFCIVLLLGEWGTSRWVRISFRPPSPPGLISANTVTIWLYFTSFFSFRMVWAAGQVPACAHLTGGSGHDQHGRSWSSVSVEIFTLLFVVLLHLYCPSVSLVLVENKRQYHQSSEWTSVADADLLDSVDQGRQNKWSKTKQKNELELILQLWDSLSWGSMNKYFFFLNK